MVCTEYPCTPLPHINRYSYPNPPTLPICITWYTNTAILILLLAFFLGLLAFANGLFVSLWYPGILIVFWWIMYDYEINFTWNRNLLRRARFATEYSSGKSTVLQDISRLYNIQSSERKFVVNYSMLYPPLNQIFHFQLEKILPLRTVLIILVRIQVFDYQKFLKFRD
jgi:hypothetical protein